MNEEELIQKISYKGIETGSFRRLIDIANSYAIKKRKFPREIAELVLLHICELEDYFGIVGALHLLSNSSAPTQLSQLTRLYDFTTDDSIKAAISNTLSTLKPKSLINWIESTLCRQSDTPLAIYELYVAYAKVAEANRSLPVLRKLYPISPVAVSRAYGYCGTADELKILNDLKSSLKGYEKQEVKKAISRITTRLKNAGGSMCEANSPAIGGKDAVVVRSGFEPERKASKKRGAQSRS